MYRGRADWDAIGRIKVAVGIPVIGNGDVTTPEAAKKMFDETGCHGVSVGRGAFYNPWIFNHIRDYMSTGDLPAEPPFEERIRVMTRHLDRMIEVFGEEHGCRMFRKVGPWYSKRFGPSKPFNKKIVEVSSRAEYDEIVSDYREWRAQFLDDEGQLLPRFQLNSLQPSFMDDDQPAAARRAHIPVPKGPVEVW